MCIRDRKEIIALGLDEVRPAEHTSPSINPKELKKWLDEERDILLLDTRNDYELRIGTFEKAVDLDIKTFRQFPAAIEKLNIDKDKTVVMFCTGGIRCEKASSLMKEEGFENVYHLQGGILKYLETVDKENSLWNGECFVFDQRVCLTDELEVGSYKMCFACRMPITEEEMQNEKYIEGISCIYCYDKTTKEKKERFGSRQRQILLAKERGEKHLGGKQTK